jgi:hypothetical protein
MSENSNGGAENRRQTGIQPHNEMSITRNGSSAGLPPSEYVIQRIEAEIGEQPDFTLNDYVDPDALDALFAHKLDGQPRVSGTVVFTCRGLLVTVHSNGAVELTRLD